MSGAVAPLGGRALSALASGAGRIISRKLNATAIQGQPRDAAFVAEGRVLLMHFRPLLEGRQALEPNGVGAPAVAAADHPILLVIATIGHVRRVGGRSVVATEAVVCTLEAEHDPVLLPLALQAACSGVSRRDMPRRP